MASKKPTNTIPPDKLAYYESLVKTIPDVQRLGVTMPYTSFNGNMFSFLAKDGSLALRLPRDARESFLTKYRSSLAEANGTVLKEYVAVPDSLLQNTAELQLYFRLSFEYVKSLKPKAQKKRAAENSSPDET